MKNLLLLGGLFLSIHAFGQTSKVQDVVDFNLKKESKDGVIAVYPNPTWDAFYVKYDEATEGPMEQLVILSYDGRKVRVHEKPKPEKFFVADLTPGIYTVLVQLSGKIYSDKLIVSTQPGQ